LDLVLRSGNSAGRTSWFEFIAQVDRFIQT
jgi:hypothetical protein